MHAFGKSDQETMPFTPTLSGQSQGRAGTSNRLHFYEKRNRKKRGRPDGGRARPSRDGGAPASSIRKKGGGHTTPWPYCSKWEEEVPGQNASGAKK